MTSAMLTRIIAVLFVALVIAGAKMALHKVLRK